MLFVTELAIEALRHPANLSARVTSCATEVLYHPATRNARVSQVSVEVLRKSPVLPSGGGRQPIVMIVAG